MRLIDGLPLWNFAARAARGWESPAGGGGYNSGSTGSFSLSGPVGSGNVSGTSGMTGASTASSSSPGNAGFSDFSESVGGPVGSGGNFGGSGGLSGVSGMTGASNSGYASDSPGFDGNSYGGEGGASEAGATTSGISDFDSFAFDSTPIANQTFDPSPVAPYSGMLSPAQSMYTPAPLSQPVDFGLDMPTMFQSVPHLGIEIDDQTLTSLGALQAKENPNYANIAAESWAVLDRAAANKGYLGGRDPIGVMDRRGQFEPVGRLGKGSVANLPASPETSRQVASAMQPGTTQFAGARPFSGVATHFANPEVVAARARQGTVSKNTEQWVAEMARNPVGVVGDHAFGNPDRLSLPSYSPVVTAGVNSFSRHPTTAELSGVPTMNAPQQAPSVQPESLPSRAAPGSELDMNAIFDRAGLSRPDVSTAPSPAPADPAQNVTIAQGVAPIQASSRDDRLAPLQETTINATPGVREVAPGDQLALDQFNSSQVRQSDQLNPGIVAPNGSGGFDFSFDDPAQGRSFGANAVGAAGSGVGSLMGSVIGTGVGGPVGGIIGALLGGWAGNKLGDGQPYNEAWEAADGEGGDYQSIDSAVSDYDAGKSTTPEGAVEERNNIVARINLYTSGVSPFERFHQSREAYRR